ncbi:Cytochrome P450 9e2 [Ooceraea biroi]|uniref:Cytochrome P450 9e2 n=1 Tax=Ooceraea biroi TaxID=2015173 RepID=A0A026W9Y8_OOCBI|nr:Cytochrome P450 9e2 [Ooceraea biroi]
MDITHMFNKLFNTIMDFATPGLLIRDPDLIKDITVKDFEHFPDHRSFVDENVEPLFAKNIFSLRGDRWREMRNTLSPSFTASKMKFMYELIAKCSTEFVDYLVDHPELCSSIETKKIFRRYTTDVIATTAFGVSARLRDEVDRHLAEGNGSISYESMSKMVYMDMVVSEALRKYPPVIFTDRFTAKRYELPPAQPGCKSLIIEPETVIMFPTYSLQHDPKYFPNPEKFDPERFNEENKDKIHPYTYLPFGLGPRKCIGNRFALMETKLLIAELLQKFILKPTEKTAYPVVFDKKEFALQPIGGFWLRYEKREKGNIPDWGQYMYYYHADAKYLGIMDFATPALLIRDPDLIKDITVKDFEHFPDHHTFVDEDVEPLFTKNIFSLRGDRWREMRNTLSPSFTASKMKFMYELIAKCSTEFVDYLVDHPELCSSIETKKIFRRYTTDVIATTAFGVSVNSMKDPNNEFFLKGIEATKFSSGVLTMFKFMFMRGFPRLAKALGMTFFPRATGEFFKRIVDENIKTREAQGIVRPDMIHLLMQARDKGSAHKLTLDDIVSQAFIFFLAGFDTASTLMCFVAYELAVNPDIQARLRDEVDRHLAEGNGSISYDSMSKMVYMDMGGPF